MKPLEGVRILTVEHFGAGPYGTMFLAGLGAEVVKVENAQSGGDPGRHVGPHRLGEADSQYFQSWNLNKRSVSLDLKSQRAKLEKLAAGADALATPAARLEQREALSAILDTEFRRRSTAHWLAALGGRVSVAPINDLPQALDNPFVAATGMVRPAPHPDRPDFRAFALPVKIDGERPKPAVCEPLKP